MVDHKKSLNKTAPRYEKEKKKAFEMEKTNDRYIILFRSRNDWWKMGGTSALYYSHVLAKRMDRKVNLMPDTDFFSKFWTGVVSIRDLDALERALKKLKIFKEIHLSTENVMVFDLGYKIEKETINDLAHMRENQMRAINTIIIPKTVLPALQGALYEALKITLRCNENMAVSMREQVGLQMAERARVTANNYTLIANGVIPREEGLKKMMLSLNMLLADVKIMAELDLWTVENCLRAAREWNEALRIVRKELGIKDEESTMETVKKRISEK